MTPPVTLGVLEPPPAPPARVPPAPRPADGRFCYPRRVRARRFAETLIELRREQGFEAPYAFYKARGGPRAFGLSFSNYVAMEKGASLPQPPRVLKLVEALGVTKASPQARRLFEAYVTDLFDDEDVVKALAAPSEPVPAPWGLQLAAQVAKVARGGSTVHLSLEQYRVLAEDPVAYACHVYLSNTLAAVPVEELARRVRQPASAVSKALLVLRDAGLAKLQGKTAESPLAGRALPPLAATPATAAIHAKLKKVREGWLADGEVLDAPFRLFRAKSHQILTLGPYIQDVLNMVGFFGRAEPAPDSSIHFIEGRVVRVFK